MTEQERIDRETLLRRATAAGALYVVPVLTSAARAEVDPCSRCRTNLDCPPKCGQPPLCYRPGRRRGVCIHGDSGCPCGRNDPNPCSPPQACPGCNGNAACFQDAKAGGTKGVCVDRRDGLCASFSPCSGTGSGCPAGQACFNNCCGTTPLCSECCGVGAAPSARVAGTGGPGMLYT